MRRSHSLIASCVVIILAGWSTPVAAQSWVYENPDHGFTMRIASWLEAVPAKPGDEQTIAQFKGAKKTRQKPWRPEAELTLLIAEIPKEVEGPTTGDDEDDEEDRPSAPSSLAENRVEQLNSSRTLDDYLKFRGYRLDLQPAPKKLLRSPLEDKSEREYTVYEALTSYGRERVVIARAMVLEDAARTFAIVAIGGGASVFWKDVVSSVKSFELTDDFEGGRGSAGAGDEDPYPEGSEFRDIPHRREIRDELVPGWTAYDSANYIIVTNVRSSKLVNRVLQDLEIMRTAYFERFPPVEGANMDVVSTVRLCDGYTDYLRYAGNHMDGTGGYWNFVEEELVFFNPERRVPKSRQWLAKVEPIRVLYHEAMHQYFHYSNRAASPARWFDEGYGEFFGGANPDRRKNEVKDIDKNKFRLDLIRLARKKRRSLPNLRGLLRMTKAEFYSQSPLENYAYAWAFCAFIEEQRRKPERSRQRVEAWANLADNYLVELRKATAKYREEFPGEVPEDWIVMFGNKIQADAIEATLEDIDMKKLQAAWERYVNRL